MQPLLQVGQAALSGATCEVALLPIPTLTALAAGGALGALTRHGIAVLAERSERVPAWVAILGANVGGSVLIGALVSLGSAGALDPAAAQLLRAAAVVGFCGALTTFSTFSLHTLQLVEQGNWSHAARSVVASVVGGVLGTWLGLAGGVW